MDLTRSEILLGTDNLNRLRNAHCVLVGCGGVGGYVALMLTRMGVGKLTLIDCDKVDETNINRQVVATSKTIGLVKVDVLKKMLLEINPKLEVDAIDARLCQENVAQIVKDCDYCIDAIDSVRDKVALILHCKKNNIPIVSAMGAGNRYKIPHFHLTDIFKTSNDGLAKALRKCLRDEGVKKLDVVTCDEKAEKVDGVVGSVSYYPAMCGIVIASVVINKLIEKGGENENC